MQSMNHGAEYTFKSVELMLSVYGHPMIEVRVKKGVDQLALAPRKHFQQLFKIKNLFQIKLFNICPNSTRTV